jgi:hypothetical protein
MVISTARPCAVLRDRQTRTRILGSNRLEATEDVFRTRCRPLGEEPMIRIGECPAAADRHEPRVADFREDHDRHRSLAYEASASAPIRGSP